MKMFGEICFSTGLVSLIVLIVSLFIGIIFKINPVLIMMIIATFLLFIGMVLCIHYRYFD